MEDEGQFEQNQWFTDWIKWTHWKASRRGRITHQQRQTSESSHGVSSSRWSPRLYYHQLWRPPSPWDCTLENALSHSNDNSSSYYSYIDTENRFRIEGVSRCWLRPFWKRCCCCSPVEPPDDWWFRPLWEWCPLAHFRGPKLVLRWNLIRSAKGSYLERYNY